MKLPPFVHASAFWNGVSLILAGALALLVFFGILPADYALPAGAIYAFIVAVLKFLKVNVELRAKGLIK